MLNEYADFSKKIIDNFKAPLSPQNDTSRIYLDQKSIHPGPVFSKTYDMWCAHDFW